MAKAHRAYRHTWWRRSKEITERDYQAMCNFADEGWQTFAQITARFPPEYTDQFEMLCHRARSAGLLRSDFIPVIQFMMLLQICQAYLVSLPMYQTLLSGEDLSSASALARAREYLADFVVAGMMGGS